MGDEAHTIIYCSHQLDEVERLADTLLILERGLLASFSAPGATAFLAVRLGLGAPETAAWTLAALALGIPLFVAFCLIRERSRLTR